jgi:hypothetical protein
MNHCEIRVLAWAVDGTAFVLQWVLASPSPAALLEWEALCEQWAADAEREWIAFTDGSGTSPTSNGLLVWSGRFIKTGDGHQWIGGWEELSENDWYELQTSGAFTSRVAGMCVGHPH